MKISDIISTALDPKNPKSLENNYYYESRVLEIYSKNFKNVVTFDFKEQTLATQNYLQYSTRYAKFIYLDKPQYGTGGEIVIHTAISKVERDHKNFDFLRAPFGADFEGSFFQYSLVANMSQEDYNNVEKMIKILDVVLTSPIQTAKIEFHDLTLIEV